MNCDVHHYHLSHLWRSRAAAHKGQCSMASKTGSWPSFSPSGTGASSRGIHLCLLGAGSPDFCIQKAMKYNNIKLINWVMIMTFQHLLVKPFTCGTRWWASFTGVSNLITFLLVFMLRVLCLFSFFCESVLATFLRTGVPSSFQASEVLRPATDVVMACWGDDWEDKGGGWRVGVGERWESFSKLVCLLISWLTSSFDSFWSGLQGSSSSSSPLSPPSSSSSSSSS